MPISEKCQFLLTLFVMLVLIVLVIAVKAIPKERLPYCLGGDNHEFFKRNTKKEKFVCPKVYNRECDKQGLAKRLSPQEVAQMNSLAEAMEKTRIMNGRDAVPGGSYGYSRRR